MNKRANIYLNIYSFIALLVGISCIGLSLTLGELSFEISNLLKTSSFIIGVLFGLFFITIECFLFLILNGKTKIIDLISIILGVISIVYVNSIVSFSAFFIVPIFYLIKGILRILFVDKIYLPKEFKRYCKMFNIKVKDFPKAKKKVSTKKEKEKLSVPTEDSVYV